MVDDGESFLQAGLRTRGGNRFTGQDAELIGVVTPIRLSKPIDVAPFWCEVPSTKELSLTQWKKLAHTMPLSDVSNAIQSGTIHHALVVCAFHHFALWED